MKTPNLVVVDASRLTYARYVGRTLTHKVQPSEAFPAAWIEEFREDPVAFQNKFQIEEAAPGPDAPEAA